MSGRWGYAGNGSPVGPVSLPELKQKLAELSNAKEVLVSRCGLPEWQKLTAHGLSCALIFAALSGCLGPQWSTMDSNLSSGIVDQNLLTLGMVSSDEKTSSDAIEKYALADLAKAGYLASSESLRAYLTQSGMSCVEHDGARWPCQTSRYRIERLESGGGEDRTYRIDWQVNVGWNDDDPPIKPRIIVNRTLRPEPSARAAKQ